MRTPREERRWTRTLRLAERLGVAVAVGRVDRGLLWDYVPSADYHTGPTGRSWIRWHRDASRRVVIVDAFAWDWFEARELVHEIAHVVVGTRPSRTEEVDGPLLAVEAELARRVGIPWREQFSGWEFWGDAVVGNAEWYRLLEISRREATPWIRARMRKALAS